MASRSDLSAALDDYRGLRNPSVGSSRDNARSHSALVSRYYDIVTPFYEYAWGNSFHFSPRRAGERLADAHRRHEEGVARLLDLRPGMRVVDVGCGVGGPLVTIARASGATVTGLNINARQIAIGERLVRKAGLEGTCRLVLGDFTDAPFDPGQFETAYSFEAICHTEDTDLAFRELFRLLRPGGEIAIVDWCLTGSFDATDATHRDVRDRIEIGNATPDLQTLEEQLAAVRSAGFEVLSSTDQAEESDPRAPWYGPLQGRDRSLSSLARSPAGRRFTAAFTRALERCRILPEGSAAAAEILNVAADALVEGGELGIFTPSFLVHARKPA